MKMIYIQKYSINIISNILLNFFGIKDEAKDIDYKIKSNPNYDNFMKLRHTLIFFIF